MHTIFFQEMLSLSNYGKETTDIGVYQRKHLVISDPKIIYGAVLLFKLFTSL